MKNTKHCKGCAHYRQLIGLGGNVYACHSSLDTGILRLVPAEDCLYYSVKKNNKRKKMQPMKEAKMNWTPELTAELKRLDAEGVGATEIAERLGTKAESVYNKLYYIRKQDKPAALTVAEAQRREAPEPVEVVVKAVAPQPDGLDPLIYEAFERAATIAKDKSVPVRACWRELLAASERHIRVLAEYAAKSMYAYESAVNLAAAAAVAEMEEIA